MHLSSMLRAYASTLSGSVHVTLEGCRRLRIFGGILQFLQHLYCQLLLRTNALNFPGRVRCT